ncbi:MAG: N-acetyltransferase [Anaerolineaceae bacterium]|nr:N-acetyltransferase [Anaerolineaceae bacterium]MBN2678123.1 N-acetyltransferase [Anaerolineaceae bacterium]
MDLLIRQEEENDHNAVYQVVKKAFETMEQADGNEQNLVNRLRKSAAFIPELSLVAEGDGKIIGHILFTRMKIGEHDSLALAPVAVLPEYQNRGVGGKLIAAGHRIARELGYGSVVVVGHPSYYPKFGYQLASQWNITAPFEVPDEAFMALELVEGGLKGVSGEIEYAKEFFDNA